MQALVVGIFAVECALRIEAQLAIMKLALKSVWNLVSAEFAKNMPGEF